MLIDTMKVYNIYSVLLINFEKIGLQSFSKYQVF